MLIFLTNLYSVDLGGRRIIKKFKLLYSFTYLIDYVKESCEAERIMAVEIFCQLTDQLINQSLQLYMPQ